MPFKLYAILTILMMISWYCALRTTKFVTGKTPPWNWVDVGIMVGSLLVYSVIHEAYHWWAAKIRGVQAQLHIKPYGCYVELTGMDGKFKDLPRDKKVKYSFIAAAPYFFAFPFAAVCILTGVVLLGFYFAFFNIINFFAEWVVT